MTASLSEQGTVDSADFVGGFRFEEGRMTATSAELCAFWTPGPLLTSVTSPHPTIPQRTVSTGKSILGARRMGAWRKVRAHRGYQRLRVLLAPWENK